jgi:hypothetical protein
MKSFPILYVGLSYILILAFMISSIMCYLGTIMIPDLAWHLYVAQNILEGKKLYTDFFEVNTPMIFYITLIPSYIAKIFKADSIITLKVFNLLIISALYFYTVLLIKKDFTHVQRIISYVALAYIFFLVPMMMRTSEFGQKEHLFVAFCMPYFFSLFGARYSYRNKIISGLIAGIGFCIKPFNIVLFFTTEILRKLLYGKFERESTISIMIVAGVFYVGLYFFHQEYFSEVVPLAMNGYAYLSQYNDGMELLDFFYKLTVITCGYILMPALILLFFINDLRKSLSLLGLIGASLFIVFIQKKCFFYHYIPAISFLIITISFELADILEGIKNKNRIYLRSIQITWLVFVFIALALPINFAAVLRQDNLEAEGYQDLQKEIVDHEVKRLFVISNGMIPAFPLVNYTKVEWVGKQHCQQLLDGLMHNYNINKFDFDEGIKYAVTDVIEALNENPDMVIVRLPSEGDFSKLSTSYFFKSGANYLDFFNKYPAFRRKWKNYKYEKTLDNNAVIYEIYVSNK